MAPPRLAEKTENIRRIDSNFPRMKPKKNANGAVKRETPGEYTISLLPVDCLLAIFSQLGRRSLNEMKCVSKKMSIVAHETCKKVKWIAEKLIIRRGCRGYSVTRAGCRMVVYTIRRKKRGLKRCGTMIEGKGKVVKRTIEEDFDESDHAGYDEPRETCSYCRAPESLPEQFYDLIKKFTDDFTFDSITLINIPINEEFIDRIIPLFKGIEMEGTLSLYNSPIDKDLSMQKLSLLIASLNARRFDPSGPHFPWDSLNEKFIIDFPSSKLSVGTIRTFLHKIHRFIPTSDFVTVLARFDILEFPGLILDQSVILNALKMKFASYDRYMCWEISTNSEDFDFSILGPEFTVATDKGGRWLKMKKNGMKVMASPWMSKKSETILQINTHFPHSKADEELKDAEKREALGEDTISLLPVDCLLAIFSELDRRTLDELKCVSRKMNLAARETCKKVKRRASKLILRRDCNGYSVTHTDYRMFVHTLRRNKPGMKRCGTMIKGKIEVVKHKIDDDFFEYEYEGRDEPPKTCSHCRASESLPDQFYDLIKKFTDDFTFDSLTFINIPISEKFIDRIIPLLKGFKLEGIFNFYNSPIDKDLPIQKVSLLISSLNARRFDPSDPYFPWDSLNEQFIIDFPSSRLRVGTIKTFLHKIHRFTPTSDFVPVLSRFDILDIPGLILDQSVILDALKMKFASHDGFMRWNISTNSEAFDFSILGPEFTVTTEKWRWGVEMEKKGLNGSFAILISEEYSYEPYGAYIHFIPDL